MGLAADWLVLTINYHNCYAIRSQDSCGVGREKETRGWSYQDHRLTVLQLRSGQVGEERDQPVRGERGAPAPA